jgi:hypothetical protein
MFDEAAFIDRFAEAFSAALFTKAKNSFSNNGEP